MTPAANQLTLGQLLAALEKRNRVQDVFYDFGNMVPDCQVFSYRGFSEDAALGFQRLDANSPGVEDLIVALRETLRVGEFDGYNGGRYWVTRETNLWVANWGESTGTFITGISEFEYATVLMTSWRDAA